MSAEAPSWQADPVSLLRCVIVDDDVSFLEAARVLLEADGVIVAGTAGSGADALRCVDTLHPDVVLIDIRLGEESGFDAARRLAASGHTVEMIMISTHAEVDYADLLAESPAAGFLPKAELSSRAIRGILAVSRAGAASRSGEGANRVDLEQVLAKVVEHSREELSIVRKRAEEKTPARDHGQDYHEMLRAADQLDHYAHWLRRLHDSEYGREWRHESREDESGG
jgi:DNA-binding NarL/FixJ family response regulator